MWTEVGNDRIHVGTVAARDEIESHHVWQSLEVSYFCVAFAIRHYPQHAAFDQLIPEKPNLALTVNHCQSYLVTWPKQQTATSRTTEGSNRDTNDRHKMRMSCNNLLQHSPKVLCCVRRNLLLKQNNEKYCVCHVSSDACILL